MWGLKYVAMEIFLGIYAVAMDNRGKRGYGWDIRRVCVSLLFRALVLYFSSNISLYYLNNAPVYKSCIKCIFLIIYNFNCLLKKKKKNLRHEFRDDNCVEVGKGSFER